MSRLNTYSEGTSTAGTSITVPTNGKYPIPGDLEVAIVFGHNTSGKCVTLNVPSGWSIYDSQCVNSNGDTIWTLTHVETSATVGNFSFTVSSTEYLSAVVYEFSGANTVSPIDGHQSAAFAGGATTQTTPTLTTSNNDDTVIASFAQGYTAGEPTVSSWTTDASAGAGVNLTTAHDEVSTPTSVSATATYSKAPSVGVSNILAVAPAAPNQLHEYAAANQLTGTQITVPLSSAPSAGNLELAIVYGHDPGNNCRTLTIPPSWTEYDSTCTHETGDTIWTLTHVAGADDASYTFTLDGSDYLSAIVYDLNNVDTTAPIDGHADRAFQASASTQTTAQLTPSHSDDLAIATFAVGFQVGDPTISSGSWTTDAHANSSIRMTSFHLAPPATSTTTATATYSTAPQYGESNIILINPPGAVTQPIPTHVQTAAYLNQSPIRDTDPTAYAPYLTWAYAAESNMYNVHQAGIKTIFYTTPAMPQSLTVNGSYTEEEYRLITGAYTGVQAKDCSGTSITSYPNSSNPGFVADPRNGQASAYFQAMVDWYVNNYFYPYSQGTKDWDAFFLDNNGPMSNVNAIPCNYDAAIWGQAFTSAISGVADGPFITNSLDTTDTDVATYVNNYLSAPDVIGGMYEACFNNGNWDAEEDSQIDAIQLFKSEGRAAYFGPGWWCYLNGTYSIDGNADGASVIPYRLYAYASFLLTYDPVYSTFQESFTTSPSGLSVFPETGFVPLNPTTTATSLGVYDNGGLYERAWNDCYYRGARVGSCMVVINPGSSSLAIPSSITGTYTKSAVLQGDGVLDGGSMTFGGTPPSSLSANTAAILLK